MNDPQNLIPESTLAEFLNPTATTLGKSMGGLVKRVFFPLVKLNAEMDEKINSMEQSVKNSVNNIPIENRDSTKMGLALKALEDSKYQLDSAELREMFATLISSSLDKTRNQYLSPRFSTALSQFSPEDAKFLKEIAVDVSDKPAYRFRISLSPGNGMVPLNDHYIVTNFDKDNDYVAINYACNELALDNLVALNIINVKDHEWRLKDEAFFDYLLKSSDFISTKKAIEKHYLKSYNNKNIKVDIEKDYIKFTTFGKKFIDAVIN